MTTIKTIALIIMMQLISGNLIASITTSKADIKTRPGDGDDKYNPKTKDGESLKGYFYRLYGDNTISAKEIEFKGPFKRPKVRRFLRECQKQNGNVKELYTVVKEDKTIKARGPLGRKLTSIFVHHITLKTKVACLYNNEKIAQTWAAVYLDSDKNSDDGINVYVDYDDCDADDRAYLEVGEYSIHYDQNSRCIADLSNLSDD